MRSSKGLGLGLMLSRGGLGNELCFYDHRRVSSLGKWGAILLASVISFGLYLCYPIDDGGGYSFVIVASFAFLSFFFLTPFPLFFAGKDIEARGESLTGLRSWCFLCFIFSAIFTSMLYRMGKRGRRWFCIYGGRILFQLYIPLLKEFFLFHIANLPIYINC